MKTVASIFACSILLLSLSPLALAAGRCPSLFSPKEEVDKRKSPPAEENGDKRKTTAEALADPKNARPPGLAPCLFDESGQPCSDRPE